MDFTTTRGQHNEVIFTEEQEQYIVDMYVNEKMSIRDIGKLFNISHGAIDRIADKYNLERWGFGGKGGKRKYTLNDHYFDEIDNQNKAYILGFLYADGYNCETSQTVKMQLQEGDKEILEKIRKEINSSKPLKYVDNSGELHFGYICQNTYLLEFHGAHITRTLRDLGMMQNKSLKLTFPKWLRPDLVRHFIRGVFDGDGCLYIKGKNCTAKITSTEDFCKELVKIVREYLDINSNYYSIKNLDITKNFMVGGKRQVKIFLDWIYEDAELYLERKHQKYINEFYNSSQVA
jgi:hypothetical protein